MAAWSYFHTRVMPRVIGCPVPVVDAELRNAAIEFFDRTRAWREWLDPVTIGSKLEREIDIDVPMGSEVVRIEQITANGKPIPVDGAFESARDTLRYSTGDGASSPDRRVLILSRSFPPGTVIQAMVSLKPTESAGGFPDHLCSQYKDPIVFGALSRIRTISGQSFSDDMKAAVDQAMFEREVGRVSSLVYRSSTNTMPRSRVKWC